MIWRGDNGSIWLLERRGSWVRYNDTWTEAETEGAYFTAPRGLIEPKRGFGKVWREQLQGPDSSIGWAISQEVPVAGELQALESGLAVYLAQSGTYVLLSNGRWR